MVEAAESDARALASQLEHAHAANEVARQELKAAGDANARLTSEHQRAEAAVDALEREHRRFVEHASELAERKEAALAVRTLWSFVVVRWSKSIYPSLFISDPSWLLHGVRCH